MFKRLALVPLVLASLSGAPVHAQSNAAQAPASSAIEQDLEAAYGVPLTPLATYAAAHTSDGELSIPGRHLVLVAAEPTGSTGSRPHYAAFIGPAPADAPYAPPLRIENGENNVPARLATGPYDALAEAWEERMPQNTVRRIDGRDVWSAIFKDVRFAGVYATRQPDGSLLLEAQTGTFGLSGLPK